MLFNKKNPWYYYVLFWGRTDLTQWRGDRFFLFLVWKTKSSHAMTSSVAHMDDLSYTNSPMEDSLGNGASTGYPRSKPVRSSAGKRQYDPYLENMDGSSARCAQHCEYKLSALCEMIELRLCSKRRKTATVSHLSGHVVSVRSSLDVS